MLASVPSPAGFALDEHHRPHVTVLQRYVNTADLDSVYNAIGALFAAIDLAKLTLTGVAIRHMAVAAYPGIGLAGIVVKPGPEVLDFQARLIEALAPFTRSGGTADAYVRTAAEPEINAATIDYIENYVPAHSGAKYVAHITVGLARLDDLATIEAAAFEPFAFAPASLSVYQLGNNGTASKLLKSWRKTDS
jgi:hypothetical protein